MGYLVLATVLLAIIICVGSWALWRFCLRCHQEKVEKVLNRLPLLIGLLFVVVSGWVLWKYHEGSLHSLSEGFFVAGWIVLAVDPLLKKRLLKEFAIDLFPHMIGYDLPDKIKDRLRDMVRDTKLYRENMTMDLSLSMENDEVKILFETAFDLVNPTSSLLPYRHHLTFEQAEQTQNLTVTLPDKLSVSISIPLPPYPCGVYDYQSNPIQIKPNRKPNGSDPKYHFSSSYSQTYPKTGFHLQTFGYPTIGFTLTLKQCCEELEVLATAPTDHPEEECKELTAGHPRKYDELFMKFERVEIRWRPNEIKKNAEAEVAV